MLNYNDTICAVATATGRGLMTVVRISGPRAVECLSRVSDFAPDEEVAESPFRVSVQLRLPQPLGLVPAAAYVWANSRSYTGQRSVELHLPASPPIIERLMQQLQAAGARGAGPGEFTLRAFLAGRLDLLQAEAVLGTIHADEPAELRRALDQLAGGVSTPLEAARERLLEVVAHLEAGLDFVEEDIEFIERYEVRRSIAEVQAALADVADRMGRGQAESGRARIVLRGLPNAGKSTLMNVLCGEPVAIVADVQGTTRDPVEAHVRLGQFEIQFVDTAGLEEPAVATVDCRDDANPDQARTAAIAASAQTLGERASRQAMLQLLCIDLARPQLSDWERNAIRQRDGNEDVVLVGTRADIAASGGLDPRRCDFVVSAATGAGIESLLNAIQAKLHDQVGQGGTASTRSLAALAEARESLRRAEQLIDDHGPEELVTVELRTALDAIGRLTGRIYTDDILDQVFSRFCIGK